MLEQSDFNQIRQDVRSELADAQMVAAYAMREQDVQRQAIEDERAIHRNRNRFLTLAVALLLGLVITYTLNNRGIPALGIKLPASALKLSPYSFVITVLLDSGLALYAYVKRY